MAEEKEIKLELSQDTQIQPILETLNQHGFMFDKTVRQKDIYFDNPHHYFSTHDKGLRIRYIENKAIDFTFKTLFYLSKRTQPWYVEEHVFPLPSTQIKEWQLLLKRFSFTQKETTTILDESVIRKTFEDNNITPSIAVEKKRSYFNREGDCFIIDEVKNLGTFIEIECQINSPHSICDELGMNEIGKKTVDGYPAMLMRKQGISTINKKETYSKNPIWNVLETERELYQKLNDEKT